MAESIHLSDLQFDDDDNYGSIKCVGKLKDLHLEKDRETNHIDENHPNKLSISNAPKTTCSDRNNVPILLFAGEACHDQYFSTAHGAFLSGTEQAVKLLQFHTK